MNLMESRYVHLKQSLEGFKQTGISLIEFDGTRLLPSYAGDDLGIYILVPKLVTWFNLSLDTGIALFIYGVIGISLLSGFIACYFLYQSWLERIVAWTGIVTVAKLAHYVGDVYIFYAMPVVALIPWVLYLTSKDTKRIIHILFMLVVGVIAGTCHYVRCYSEVPIIICIFFLYIGALGMRRKSKIIILSAFLLGYGVAYNYFNTIYKNYVHYCQEYLPHHTIANKGHVFWHQVYIGFGFLNLLNKDNISYSDMCAASKVQSIDPSVLYCSKEYESILKQEVLSLIKHNITFAVFTICAKMGILLFFIIIFSNIGLYVAWLYRKPWNIELAFLCAVLFSFMAPLLTVPILRNALGLVTFSILYSILSINFALSHGLYDAMKGSFKYIFSYTRMIKIRSLT